MTLRKTPVSYVDNSAQTDDILPPCSPSYAAAVDGAPSPEPWERRAAIDTARNGERTTYAMWRRKRPTIGIIDYGYSYQRDAVAPEYWLSCTQKLTPKTFGRLDATGASDEMDKKIEAALMAFLHVRATTDCGCSFRQLIDLANGSPVEVAQSTEGVEYAGILHFTREPATACAVMIQGRLREPYKHFGTIMSLDTHIGRHAELCSCRCFGTAPLGTVSYEPKTCAQGGCTMS